ncbi:MAG: hypothetical protein WCI55_01360 [Armatimonadota bacterium]
MEDLLRQALARHQAKLDENQIEARLGTYQGCPFLKLDKSCWHNRGEVEVPGEIFFSIWLDENDRLTYNIHAFKLRHLTAYKLQSRKFAADFRNRLQSKLENWPNVSVAHGPLTLMQGWIKDESQIDNLITEFISIHHIIDKLLEENKK